jgi:signal transduction histidine kinase
VTSIARHFPNIPFFQERKRKIKEEDARYSSQLVKAGSEEERNRLARN